jgi:hypothetical protein
VWLAAAKRALCAAQELEVVLGDEHISFTTAKIGSLVDVCVATSHNNLVHCIWRDHLFAQFVCAWAARGPPALCYPDLLPAVLTGAAWCCKSIPRRSGRGCRDRFLCAPQPHHVSRSVLTLFALIAGYCTIFQGPRGPQMLLLPYPGPQGLRVFGSQSALQNQAGANVIPLSFIL